ncbi:MAG: DUF4307 domain-containing protein [Micrococcales bacterium]|nr:DUF4307 domain-containing protein [Micrococcales bacterium]
MSLPRPAPGQGKWWVMGAIGITIGVALATWFGLAISVGQITWKTTAYKVVSDSEASVTFEVHRPDGRATTCTVQALDVSYGVVGTLDVPVEAGPKVAQRSATVKTTSRANTVTAKSCTQ